MKDRSFPLVFLLTLFLAAPLSADSYFYAAKHHGLVTCARTEAGTIEARRLQAGQFKNNRKLIKNLRRQNTLTRREQDRPARLVQRLKNEIRICRAAARDSLGITRASLRRVDSQQQLLDLLRAGSRSGRSFGAGPDGFSKSDGNAPSAEGGTGISSTYVQVDGVDEADFVKYDGAHLFVANNEWASGAQRKKQEVRILETNPVQADATEIQRLALPFKDAEADIRGLYLSKHGASSLLTTIASNYGSYYALDVRMSAPVYRENETFLTIHNVSDIRNIAAPWKAAIDGTYIASRRVENTLYLITRFTPTSVESADETTRDIPQGKLLPRIKIGDQDEARLFEYADCYREEESLAGIPSDVVSITAFDLASKAWATTCVLAAADTTFVSTQSLYLVAGAWDGQTSRVHKFLLEGSKTSYRGSGVVPGNLSYFAQPEFLLGEQDGIFRMVTSMHNDFLPPTDRPVAVDNTSSTSHRLTLLKEDAAAQALIEVAHLPNQNRPEPIGKPNEQVYSVRYTKNRAYLVTFLKTDPFYVIDLSDQTDPKIAGQLQIPGFSSLLHPLSDDLVLSIGKDSIPSGNDQFVWFQGIKVELYDVSLPQKPKSVGLVQIGKRGSESEALTDHHALTFLPGSAGAPHRLVIPVTRHDGVASEPQAPENFPGGFPWVDSGLHLFEIRNYTDAKNASLVKTGEFIAEKFSDSLPYPSYVPFERSVLHDDTLFYIHGPEQVLGGFWPANKP